MTTRATKTTKRATSKKRAKLKKRVTSKQRSNGKRRSPDRCGTGFPAGRDGLESRSHDPEVDSKKCADRRRDASNEVSPLAAYRMRMRLVGDLLNASVGELMTQGGGEGGAGHGAGASDRVGREAYLHIMGQVFEALDGLSQAVPLDDLSRISRIVAEQRRAELNTRKVEALAARARTGNNPQRKVDEDTAETNGEFRLPAHFNELVRQLYGVTLADDVNTVEAEAIESEPRLSGSGG